jgi:2'-5' RNA ligase
MRLFVALDPSPEAVSHLVEALPSLDGLRPSQPETWHITLVFCGEVDASTATCLEPKLATLASQAAPQRLRLRGSGAFGGTLWVGVEGELGELAAACRRAARDCGVSVEERRFHPHLTLGRAIRGGRPTRQVAALAAYAGPLWTSTELRLVRSDLGAAVRHETVRAWSLGAG